MPATRPIVREPDVGHDAREANAVQALHRRTLKPGRQVVGIRLRTGMEGVRVAR